MKYETVQESKVAKADWVRQICGYIRENVDAKLTLSSLGQRFGASPYQLQRAFVEVMGISPRKYLEECRVSVLKLRLGKGEPVVNALHRTGYSSQSWLYENSRARLGMTPATYKQGGSGMTIMYATGDSLLGRMLVATTDHGICNVDVGESDAKLVGALKKQYPRAIVMQDSRAQSFLDGVNRHLEGQDARLPLDLRGTSFQIEVWKALQQIPLGETRSYSEVAEMVGKPSAVRAVANACGSNPVPLIIPCHRVIRKDGSLGGYGLGLPRKRLLLAKERTLAAVP